MDQNKIVVAYCVWRDYPGEEATGLPWSLSSENSDGEEISCLGGYKTADEAWEEACIRAESAAVAARQVAGERGDYVVREWLTRPNLGG